jgi:hypothetical protein
LLDGSFDRVSTAFEEDQQWLTVRRGPILTACNLSNVSRDVPVASDFEILLTSAAAQRKHACIELPAESVAVLRCS